MHSEETCSPPALPRRATNQAIAAALRIWRESECYDRATVELCLEGLRALDTPTAPDRPTVQREIDGVIARWRAGRTSEVRRAG